MNVLDLSGLGNTKELVEETLGEIVELDVINRIWEKDYTLWSEKPSEISNRLGWLDCVETAKNNLPEIYDFVKSIKSSGFKNVLVLGMGGSSLAPEVFSMIFTENEEKLNVNVLDSTHPEAVRNYVEKLDYSETLYIVSTKSGGTVETLSFMKFFYNFVLNHVGKEEVGKYFAAITDPGSGLQKMAEDFNFRKIFLNDPNIGGRYSALSLFGLVPAALAGVDLEKLLSCAESAMLKSKISDKIKIHENHAAVLGALMGSLAEENMNKLTLLYSNSINYFGAWLEQLVAESTGKNGKGILPVDLEAQLNVNDYGDDRIFVYTRLKDDNPYDQFVHQLKTRGIPVIEIVLDDLYALGSEFFNWEFATAVASWKMKLQPFDQPNVESAKIQARSLLDSYKKEGKLTQPKISFEDENVLVYSQNEIDGLKNSLTGILSNLKEGSYICLQAFVNPTKEIEVMFNDLRTKILKKYKIATVFGFGPRFLHSTGQLHKGDDGSGIFIQFIESGNLNLGIPIEADKNESDVTFDILIRSQALGDREALISNDRKVITFDIKTDLHRVINDLINAI